MSKFYLSKLKILLLVVCFLIVCLLPFPINATVNGVCFNPVGSADSEYLCKVLTESLYPEIYNSKLTARRTSELNFGKYEVSYYLVEHTADSFEYGLEVTTGYSCSKCTDKNFNVIPERYNVDGIAATGNGFSWDKVDDSAYYFAYFRIANANIFDRVTNQIKYAEEYFVTADGERPVEWIGYSLEDRIWGLSVADKDNFNLNKNPSSLFELFTVLGAFPKEIAFISSLGLFGDLKSTDFKALSQQCVNLNPDIIMMYGKGTTVKEFKDNADITPVLFKNIKSGEII